MSSDSANFTARDFELLALAMTCTKEAFAIDYQKLADRGNYKNSNSSKAAWHGLKKKLDKVAAGGKITPSQSLGEGEGGPEAAASPATKKRKAQSKDDGGDDIEGAKTPVKRGRKPKASETKSTPAGEDDEEEAQLKGEGKGASAAPTPANKARKPAAAKGRGKKAGAAKEQEDGDQTEAAEDAEVVKKEEAQDGEEDDEPEV